jgi:hypothetical protein
MIRITELESKAAELNDLEGMVTKSISTLLNILWVVSHPVSLRNISG